MRALPWLALALSLTACDGKIGGIFSDGGEDGDGGDGAATGDGGGSMLDRDNYEDSTDRDGYIDIPVEVGPDATAFMVTVESREYPTLESVYDPSGDRVLHWEDWYYSDESLTSAFFWDGKVMSFNWPVRADDGTLDRGTWTVRVSTLDSDGYYASNADVEVTVMTKGDGDFDRSDARVRIVWADGVDDDEEVVTAVKSSVERWREIWSSYGIELVESYHTSDLDADLGFTSTGSGDLEDNAERFDGQEMILVVGESIDGDAYTYGIAGGIPGSIEPNRFSWVTLSWLAHAGGNGRFSDDEIRLMGETAAHECGHFMGLFHPVESSFNYWDALDDTESCSNATTCENRLGDNLMFPYPICGWETCDPQGVLTDDQEGVAQRYIGAL